MDFDLSRIDYLIAGVTHPETLRLVPGVPPKVEEKIVIGDKSGVLQCVGIKNEEAHVVFKTLPGKEITAVRLAGAPGTLADKIFTASGSEVKGYTRKGKVFLSMETTLAETVTSMCVSEADLVVGSGRTVTHYRDLQELHSYVCEHTVLDIVLLNAVNSNRIRIVAAVANKDVLLLEQGRTASRVVVAAGPTRLVTPPPALQSAKDPVVLYGAADGSIGILTFNGSEIQCRCLVPPGGLGAAGVSCASWWGMGPSYLLVGRQDGAVQAFLLDPDNYPDKPQLKYTYVCGERVTSVVGGGCTSGQTAYLLVSTYSGRVFALRARTSDSQPAVRARLTALQSEVNRLERQVRGERERYQRSTLLPPSAVSTLSAPPALQLDDELTGVQTDGQQTVTLWSALPLDLVLLHAPHALNVATDSAAVVSTCTDLDSSTEYLATVRCQAETRQLCLKIRNLRPRLSSWLSLYAVPAGPPRVARLRRFPLVCLPHYSLDLSAEQLTSAGSESAGWSSLSVLGSFSAAEMSGWLARALPSAAARPGPAPALARSHVFIHTTLLCQYQKGSATFKSDNVSTIAILKDHLSRCAVESNITLSVDFTVAEDCLIRSFRSIEDQLRQEYRKKHEAYIRKAISELDLDTTSDSVSTILCEDYVKIAQTPGEDEDRYQFLTETIVEWYSDACALQLRACEQDRLRQLETALQHHQLDTVAGTLSRTD